MDPPVGTAIAECRQAHQRLLTRLAGLDDETARRPSRLPDWTVGQVLTHIARNADSHARRLAGALDGREVPRYVGGEEQRDREIDEGSGRPAAALLEDVAQSARQLEEIWDRSERAGWPNEELSAGDQWPTSGSPLRRLREVEVHHVDLGLGYRPADWPELYVRWELVKAAQALPNRVTGPEAARLLAWLLDRGAAPAELRLGPWM